MSQLLQKIKEDCLAARKEKDTIKSLLLSTVVSDVEMIGKNAKREVADDDVVVVVKKFMKGINEILTTTFGDHSKTIREKEILTSYLPVAPSEAELSERIDTILFHGANTVGWVMKDLKFVYGSSLDGKLASRLINEKLNNRG